MKRTSVSIPDTSARDRSQPLRVGVVGSGAVAERYHLPALLASADVRITAFVDPTLARARALADRAGQAVAVSSHRELPGVVDLAIVTVPNALHESVAVALLTAGVHVLVEKPMARTVAECDRMMAAAAATGTVLAVGHDFRHFPIARFARDFFAAGMLGPVRRVDVSQSAGAGWPSASPDVLSPSAGGGALITFGIHLVDLLWWWLGDIQVSAYRDDAAGGVEAECECELTLAAGAAPLRLEVSRLRGLRDTAIVECERGTVELGIHEPAMFRLTLGGASRPLIGAVPDPEFDRTPLPTVFARQLADVVRAIRTGGAPLVDGTEGRRAVAVVESCYAVRQPLRHPWSFPECYAAIGRTPG
jgi:predicted dehydrogenase